jgi:hypothetical protein
MMAIWLPWGVYSSWIIEQDRNQALTNAAAIAAIRGAQPGLSPVSGSSALRQLQLSVSTAAVPSR